MSDPAPYPRIPHLVSGRDGSGDDRVLPPAQAARCLARPVLIEEKLDGANVMLSLHDDAVRASLRAGTGAIDRAGQLGPLRAWVGPRSDRLRMLLRGGLVLYAEWLYWTHTVHYDRLPSYLVGLDLRSPDGLFLDVEERNARLGRAEVAIPPEVARGVFRDLSTLDGLMGISRFGHDPMEGLMVRALDGTEPRIAKLLRASFERAGDLDWSSRRHRNELTVPGEHPSPIPEGTGEG